MLNDHLNMDCMAFVSISNCRTQTDRLTYRSNRVDQNWVADEFLGKRPSTTEKSMGTNQMLTYQTYNNNNIRNNFH